MNNNKHLQSAREFLSAQVEPFEPTDIVSDLDLYVELDGVFPLWSVKPIYPFHVNKFTSNGITINRKYSGVAVYTDGHTTCYAIFKWRFVALTVATSTRWGIAVGDFLVSIGRAALDMVGFDCKHPHDDLT